MSDFEHINFHEMTMINKIIRDETWLEGERRGCFVPSSDSVVRANVCGIILRIGAQVREAALREIDEARLSGTEVDSGTVHHRAA